MKPPMQKQSLNVFQSTRGGVDSHNQSQQENMLNSSRQSRNSRTQQQSGSNLYYATNQQVRKNPNNQTMGSSHKHNNSGLKTHTSYLS